MKTTRFLSFLADKYTQAHQVECLKTREKFQNRMFWKQVVCLSIRSKLNSVESIQFKKTWKQLVSKTKKRKRIQDKEAQKSTRKNGSEFAYSLTNCDGCHQ